MVTLTVPRNMLVKYAQRKNMKTELVKNATPKFANIGILASEIQKLTSVVQDVSKKVQEIREIKQQSSEIFKCDFNT